MEYEHIDIVWAVISVRPSQSNYTVTEKLFSTIKDAELYVEERQKITTYDYSIQPMSIERIKQ